MLKGQLVLVPTVPVVVKMKTKDRYGRWRQEEQDWVDGV